MSKFDDLYNQIIKECGETDNKEIITDSNDQVNEDTTETTEIELTNEDASEAGSEEGEQAQLDYEALKDEVYKFAKKVYEGYGWLAADEAVMAFKSSIDNPEIEAFIEDKDDYVFSLIKKVFDEEGIDLVEADEIDENGERIVSESVEDADSYLSLSMSLDGADLANIECPYERLEHINDLIGIAFNRIMSSSKAENKNISEAILDINGNKIGEITISF